MSTLWVVPPLLCEPDAKSLARLMAHPLFAHASALSLERTGAPLVAIASQGNAADWARARLRALAAHLVEARAASMGSDDAVVGVGLGEIGALALAGALEDTAALYLLLDVSLAPLPEALGVWSDTHVSCAPEVACARASETAHFFEIPPAQLADTLSLLREHRASLQLPIVRSRLPVDRAEVSRSSLQAYDVRPPQRVYFRPSSGELVAEAPRSLDDRAWDFVRVLKSARNAGVDHVRMLGEELPAPSSRVLPEARVRSPQPGYYLGQVTTRSSHGFVAERVFSLAEEPYLRTAARLHKQCVLPGSFELEIGIEAGSFLHPELVPVAVEDARFHSALKLFEGQPVNARISAESQPVAAGRQLVKVRIASDLTHKSGRVLQRDRNHCELNVIMGPRFDDAPEPIAWDARSASPDPDVPGVLYQSRSPLWLGPYFEAVWDTQRSGASVRSIYRNPADLTLAAFHAHLGAPLLMDAILQNPLRRSGPYLATGIPLSIQRVRFFGLMNERAIADSFGHLVLSSVVDDDLPYCRRMQASTPDGHILLEVERFETIPLGFIDRRDLSVHITLPELAEPTPTREHRPQRGA